jgi:hypothetical protein
MMTVTAPNYLASGNLKLVVKIAAASDAQHEHLGQKMSLVLMVMQLAPGEGVP